MNRERVESIAGGFFFVAFIAAHLIFGITPAIRVLGIACIVTGLTWSIGRSIPVGIEDRPPSFFLHGPGALLVGLLMVILGTAFLFFAGQAACLLGWAEAKSCI
jgi:hypothetical protein